MGVSEGNNQMQMLGNAVRPDGGKVRLAGEVRPTGTVRPVDAVRLAAAVRQYSGSPDTLIV